MKLFIFRLRVSNSKFDVILRNSVSQLDFVTREFRTSSQRIKSHTIWSKYLIRLNFYCSLLVFETVDFYERFVVSSWGGLKHINSSWIFLDVTHQTIKLFRWFIKKIRLFISQCFDYKEKILRTFFCVDSLIT